jgi:hypothetical protein
VSPVDIPLPELFPPAPEVGQWLEAEEQEARFEEVWPSLRNRFFKLETLQEYEETGVPVYDAWKRGDLATVHRLAEEQAREQADDPVDKRIESQRVRLLRIPVTDYVRFENEVYRYLAQAGEKIFGVEEELAARTFEAPLFDFLLFDETLVFVHDYDDQGVRRGSWLVQDSASVAAYRQVADSLLEIARPFEDLVSEYF